MTFKNDDLIYMASAGLALVAFWYWYNGHGESESTYSDSNFLENLGDSVTTAINNGWTPPSTAKPYLAAIAVAEAKYGLPNNLLARLLYQESRFRADIITGKVKSSVGATGIAQFMPATAKQFGINPLDPFESIDAAGQYLKQLYRRFGSWKEAVASYNWGQGNVSRKGLGNAPTETRNYYTQILSDIGLA